MTADCSHFLGLLLDSLDESLDPADQRAYDEHLARCPDCVAALQEHVVLRSTLRDLDQMPVGPLPALPETLVARCVAAMRAARGEGSEGRADGSARIA